MKPKQNENLARQFAIPHLDAASPLHPLLAQLTSTRRPHSKIAEAKPKNHYWNASYFGLDRISYFKDLNETQQNEVLSNLSDFYLSESYFIEKSGFEFNSKMMALAPSVEEKSFYAHFAADEAVHLKEVMACMKRIPTDDYLKNPFLVFLGETIQEGDRDSLVYLIQVLLEGFGIAYYSQLAEGCNDDHYRAVIKQILKDEAFHHGSGVLMARSAGYHDPKTREFLGEMVKRFAQLFQDWPQAVLGSLEKTLGHLSKEQRRAILASLQYEEATAQKLAKVKTLAKNHATESLLSHFDLDRWFTARSLDRCVDEMNIEVFR